MVVTDEQVLSVLDGKQLSNQEIVSQLGENVNPVEVRKVLKRLESGRRISVVDRRKTGKRGRPSSVWGVSQNSD